VTDANIGYFRFKLGDGASTEVFSTIEEAFSISGVGKTRELVDVTSFDSNGNREFIGGLADGQEITVECNYVPAATVQAAMIAAVEAGLNRNFQVVDETAGSPVKTYAFTASPLSWVINPSVDSRNTITFTVKISGDITVTP
jgi:hypothetical protein